MMPFWCACWTAAQTVMNSSSRARRRELVRVAILGDRHARRVLHDEVRPAVCRRARVEDRGDVRMVHQRERLALGLEPRDDLARVHAELDQLERDGAREWARLLGQIDDAHAAFAEDS